MSDLQITIKLRGEKITSGAIEISRLVTLSDKFQKALQSLAYSLESEKQEKPEKKSVESKTSLSLTGISQGSTELSFAPAKLQTQEMFDASLLENTMDKLVAGVDSINTDSFNRDYIPYMPDGWDADVVELVYQMGSIFPGGISDLELAYKRGEKARQATYNSQTRARVRQLRPEPRERIDKITGQLLQVNFKGDSKDRFTCRVYTEHDTSNYIKCYFDEADAERIENALRRTVGLIGISELDPFTQGIKAFRIKQIFIYTDQQDYSSFEKELLKARNDYRKENDTAANLRSAWQDVIHGRTHDISTLWDDIDDE